MEVGRLSIDLTGSRIWPQVPAGLGPEGSVPHAVVPITKEKAEKKERKGGKKWEKMRNAEMKLCSFSSLRCPGLRH